KLKVAGILPESGATRALGGAVALMSVDAAQLLLNKPDRVDVINVKVKKGESVDAVRKRVVAQLGPAYSVEAPERRGKRLARMMLTLTTVMRLVSVVSILVGIFIVYNTLAIAVVQRRREIAIQRALGVTRRLCWLLVVLEALVLGVLGALVGVPVGVMLARSAMNIVTVSISTLYTEIRPVDPNISPKTMLLVAIGAIIASAVAALRPAHRAASTAPAMVLAARGTTGGLTTMILPARGLMLSAVSLAVAWAAAQLPSVGNEPWWGYLSCLLVLAAGAMSAPAALHLVQKVAGPIASRLSITMRLGAEGLTRDGPRAATTASALMLGLALYIGISGVVNSFKVTLLNWVDLAVPADLSVLSGSSLPDARTVPMEPSLGEDLAQDPGVEVMFHQRFRNIDLGDNVTKIQAMDARAYLSRARLPVVEQVGPVDGEALEQGEVLISENLARTLNLHAGGTVTLPTLEGPRPMRIRAVVEDYSSEIGAIFMDWPIYARLFQDPLVDSFNLYLRPGADPNAVRTRILARHGEGRGLNVVTHHAFRTFVENVVDDAFAATRALQLVAVLIALMGIINTLLAAVLDRIREIGVLRAVGATKGQVVTILTSEAVLLGVTSAVLATLAGVGFGFVFTEVVADTATGWRLPYHVPMRAVGESAVLALVVSAVAAAIPARRGASVDIVRATQVE
ncbi:MAG: FtsX-like permease family protein, partial [Myxococcota bacterium]